MTWFNRFSRVSMVATLICLFGSSVTLARQVPIPEDDGRDCGEYFGFYGSADGAKYSPALKGEFATVVLTGYLDDPFAARRGLDSFAAWEIAVEDRDGRVLRNFWGSTLLAAATTLPVRVEWNGRDDAGALVPADLYYVRFSARSVTPDQVTPADEALLFTGRSIPQRMTLDELAALAFSWSDSPFPDALNIWLDPAFTEDEVRLHRGGPGSSPAAPGVTAVNPPHEAIPYSFWYGNSHSHTTRSDGGGSACAASCASSTTRAEGAYPDGAYVIADAAEDSTCPTLGGGLDWMLIAEHNHLINDADPSDSRAPNGASAIYAQGFTYANAANNSAFVAIYGMEWGTITNCGHVNMYDVPVLMGWEAGHYDVLTPQCEYADINDVYDMANRAGNRSPTTNLPHLVLNHPTDGNMFETYKKTAFGDAAVQGIAVISGAATSCAVNFPTGGTGSTGTYKDRMIQLLTAGWKLAPEAHQDNHGDNYGNHSELRTVALAENLTRECVLRAQYNRRVYATQDRDGQLIFTATPTSNAVVHHQGESIGGSGGVAFHASWWQPDNDTITSYRLLRGQVGGGCTTFACLTTVVTGFSGTPSGAVVINTTENIGTGNYYYLIEIQQPGKLDAFIRHTVSAPIFVNFGAADAGTTPPSCGCTPPNPAPTAVPSSGCGTVVSQLNANASGGTPPYTYLWSPATGLSSTTIANPVATVSTTRTYSVVVTGSGVGACSSQPANITVTASNPVVAPAALPSTICAGGSSQLSSNPSGGVAPYTFLWSPATGLSSTTAQNPTASPVSTTPYSVVATDSLGCASPSSNVTVTVVPGAPPVAPTNVNAHGEATQVVVSWTGTLVSGTYEIWRAAGNCSAGFTAIGSVPFGTLTFTDTTVVSGTSYCYRVYANNGSCTSVASGCTASSCAVPGPVPEVSGGGAIQRFKVAKAGGTAVALSFEWRGLGYMYHVYGVANEANIDLGTYASKFCDLQTNALGTWTTDSSTLITWTMTDIAQLPASNLLVVAEQTGTEGPYGFKSSGNRRSGDTDRTTAVNQGCPVGIGSLVISQVYGGGGNTGAVWRNDFIEVFNRGSGGIDVNGWSVQYASSSGTTWQVTALSAVSKIIPPGGYFLIQEAVGAGGTQNLPTPDATGTIAMSASNGKVALVNTTTALTGSGCPFIASVADFVGYGTANCFEGGAAAPGLGNTTADLRNSEGCNDTNVNSADFLEGAPDPRNSAFPVNICP